MEHHESASLRARASAGRLTDPVRAYVINLQRSAERRAHMLAQLTRAGVDYRFVEAIDDRTAGAADPGQVHPSYFSRSDWRPGRIGNGLSHLRAYETILSDGRDVGLVLEDDVTLSADFAAVVEAVAEHLVGAEIALLNFDSRDTCELSRDGLVQLPYGRALALPIDVRVPVGGAAYLMTREACERMAATIIPIRAHSDDWDYWYQTGALDRVRCVYPLVATKSADFESTIDYHAPGSLRASFLRIARECNIELLNRAISYRRKTIWSKWHRVALVDKQYISKPSRID
jgi:glycosyl transferase, family 25